MQITINGEQKTFDGELDTPLLWVIRDELGLKGTKFGCGMGLFGACTVQLNGSPIRSCITPVQAVQGQSITTIEGLGSPESLHPIQASWMKHNVPQCGYCQSGQIMSASALLADNPNPSDSDIDIAMSGNVCRCGTYPRIKAAIKDAANQMSSKQANTASIKTEDGVSHES